MHQVQILLVESNRGDIRLTVDAISQTEVPNHISVVENDFEALAFLRKEGKYASAPRPDMVILNLTLSNKNGFDVLTEIKSNIGLRRIPIIVLADSKAKEDVEKAYYLNANSCISKPVDLDRFFKVASSIGNYWLRVVELPSKENEN